MSRNYVKSELLRRCNAEIQNQIFEINELFSSITVEDKLITSPLPGKWSAKQCLEHLNATLELYLPRIGKVLDTALLDSKEDLSHGFIGYKFFSSVLPVPDRKLRTMKTFKFLEPGISGDSSIDVVMRFAVNMKELGQFVEESKDKNIQRLKVTSAAGPLLKLRLGDAYLFILNHNIRHIAQAKRAVELCLMHRD